MPGEGRMPSRRARVALGAALLLTSGCVGGDGSPTPRRPPASGVPVRGDLLLTTGANLGGGLALLPLPGAVTTELESSVVEDAEFVREAVFGDDGTAYVVAEGPGRGRVVAIPSEGNPTATATPGYVQRLTSAGGRLLALVCGGATGGVWALDPEADRGWRRVAPGGCPGAVSPDGRWHVWARGGELHRAPIDGGAPPEVILDLDGVEALGPARIPRPQVFEVSLGDQGLAVSVGDSVDVEHGAVVVVPMPDGPGGAPGEVDVVVLGEAYPNTLAWRPDGRLLAFLSCVNCFAGFGFGQDDRLGELHVYDVATGSARQVAAGHETIIGLVWSPDGRALATLWRPDELLLVSAGGRVLGRRPVQGLPWDWRA